MTGLFSTLARKNRGAKMSQLHRVAKTSAILLKTLARLTQQMRRKTTSEHVLKLRGGVQEAFKTDNQVAMEHKSHMNFMPVPEGSWEETYRARNTKWTKMLIFSISALGITIYCMYVANCFFLHTLPSRRKILPDDEKIGKVCLSEEEEDFQ